MKSIKYILLITVILFIFIFLVTLPGRLNANKNDDNSSVSDTTASDTSVSETTKPVNTAVQNGTSAIIVGGEPEDSTAITTATGENSMEIDNAWAFFLVNQTNPLPDNYAITTKVVQGKFAMDDRCADYMINMISDAKAAGINLNIVSAYRSVEYQQTLLDNDTAKYEKQGLSHEDALKKASEAVAVPGQSEHNAGICADILNEGNYSLTEGFEDTAESKWLFANAENYGFILRYPKGKESITGIEYEPWHYRFVGIYQAKKIKASGLCLEEYYQQQQ